MTEFDRMADAFAQQLSAAGVGYRWDVVLFVLLSTSGGMLQNQIDEGPMRAPDDIKAFLDSVRDVTMALYSSGTGSRSKES